MLHSWAPASRTSSRRRLTRFEAAAEKANASSRIHIGARVKLRSISAELIVGRSR